MNNKYINFIKILEAHKKTEPVVDEIIKFIESYDGQNKQEFENMVEALIQLLDDIQIFRIKSEGYDQIKDANEQRKKQEEKLKKRMEKIKKELNEEEEYEESTNENSLMSNY